MLDWIKNLLLTIWGWIWGFIGPWIESTPLWQLILMGIGVVVGIVLIVVFWKIVRVVIGVLLTAGYLALAVWLTVRLWQDGNSFLIFLLQELLVVGACTAIYIGLMKSLFENPELTPWTYSGSSSWENSSEKTNKDTDDKRRKNPYAQRDQGLLDLLLTPTDTCNNCRHYISGKCSLTDNDASALDTCNRFSRG